LTWFRRAREQAQEAAGPDPADSPDALRSKVFELIGFVNQNAGRLPGEAVVLARRITDTVREVIDTAAPVPDGPAGRGLDIHAVVSLHGILDDYLPTTLRSYLALDPAVVDTPRPSGQTPVRSLLDQLDALWSAAIDLLTAVHAHDADALFSQGAFLRTKFTGSDLDL